MDVLLVDCVLIHTARPVALMVLLAMNAPTQIYKMENAFAQRRQDDQPLLNCVSTTDTLSESWPIQVAFCHAILAMLVSTKFLLTQVENSFANRSVRTAGPSKLWEQAKTVLLQVALHLSLT
jgi:hypothetical protein